MYKRQRGGCGLLYHLADGDQADLKEQGSEQASAPDGHPADRHHCKREYFLRPGRAYARKEREEPGIPDRQLYDPGRDFNHHCFCLLYTSRCV